jgi:hypothetical protein
MHDVAHAQWLDRTLAEHAQAVPGKKVAELKAGHIELQPGGVHFHPRHERQQGGAKQRLVHLV